MSHRQQEPARHHAGRPPRKPRPYPRVVPDETILPTGELSELDTGALTVPLEDSNFPTDNHGQRLRVHDEVPRTGRGSASRPALGPVGRLVVRADRRRRLRRVGETVAFVFAATLFGAVAAYLAVVAVVNVNDTTPTQVREVSPVLAVAATAMLLVAVCLFVLWRDGRPR